jgi:hypothetical protein
LDEAVDGKLSTVAVDSASFTGNGTAGSPLALVVGAGGGGGGGGTDLPFISCTESKTIIDSPLTIEGEVNGLVRWGLESGTKDWKIEEYELENVKISYRDLDINLIIYIEGILDYGCEIFQLFSLPPFDLPPELIEVLGFEKLSFSQDGNKTVFEFTNGSTLEIGEAAWKSNFVAEFVNRVKVTKPGLQVAGYLYLNGSPVLAGRDINLWQLALQDYGKSAEPFQLAAYAIPLPESEQLLVQGLALTLSEIPFMDFTHVLNQNKNTTSISTDLNVGGDLVLEASISLDGIPIASWYDLTPDSLDLSEITIKSEDPELDPMQIKSFLRENGPIKLNGMKINQGEKDLAILAGNSEENGLEILTQVDIQPALTIRNWAGTPIANFGNNTDGNYVSIQGNLTVNGSPVLTGASSNPTLPTSPVFETVTTQNMLLSGEVIRPLSGTLYLGNIQCPSLGTVRITQSSAASYQNKLVFVKGLMNTPFKCNQPGFTPDYYLPDDLKASLGYHSFRIRLPQATTFDYFLIEFGDGTAPTDLEAWEAKIHSDFVPLIVVGDEIISGVPENPVYTIVTINGYIIAGVTEGNVESLVIWKGSAEIPIFRIERNSETTLADLWFTGNIHANNI